MIGSKSFYANANVNVNVNVNNSSDSSVKAEGIFGAPIVPDIRAVNILMNVFAKMGDQASAKVLMEQLYDGTVVPYDDSSVEKNGMLGTRIGTMDENDNENENDAETLSSNLNLDLEQLEDMDSVLDLIKVVPRMTPNVVTYNTLIDACHRAGDLDAGLEALNHMKRNTNLKPDAMTYTSLISSVARRQTQSSGQNDPDLAFSLFDEMVNERIRPNGMTYCALIDVCGRCRRSDLALKGKSSNIHPTQLSHFVELHQN